MQDDDALVVNSMLAHLDVILAMVSERDPIVKISEYPALTALLIDLCNRNVMGQDWRRQVRFAWRCAVCGFLLIITRLVLSLTSLQLQLFRCLRVLTVLCEFPDALSADLIGLCQQSVDMVRGLLS